MKRSMLSAAMMMVCIAAFASAADAPPAARDPALVGDWVIESAEYRGDKSPDLVGDKLTFTADKATIMHKEQKADTARYFVDVRATPKEIDLTPLDEAGKELGRTTVGIYVVDGQTLKICMNDRPGGQRPTRFDAGAGTNSVLLTLKRAK